MSIVTRPRSGRRSLRPRVLVAWLLLATTAELKAAPPQIAYPPRAETVILYEQAAFGVIATGTPPLTYQWLKDGSPIPAADADQLVLAQCRFGDAGRYSVIVTNAEGSVTSPDAVLAVNPPKAGDVDFSFVWGGGINGGVQVIVPQPDGKVLIGGSFTTVHGAARGGIARLNADGKTDHTFMYRVPGVAGNDAVVYAIALQEDRKVLIGGDLTTVNGMNRMGVARLNADGSLDRHFEYDVAGEAGGVSALVLQPDGKILIGGSYHSTLNATSRNGIRRLLPDGSRDPGFVGVAGYVEALAIQADGKILVGGAFAAASGGYRYGVVRLNPDGTPDATYAEPSFALGSSNDGVRIWEIVVQPDGKILVGGLFTRVNGASRTAITRLNGDGTLDDQFRPERLPGDASLEAIALQPDGKLLLSGYAYVNLVNGMSQSRVVRLNADGSEDGSFASVSLRESYQNSIAIQRDGRVLIGGTFTSIRGATRPGIARLNPDGTLDSSFDNGITGSRLREGDFRANVGVVGVQGDDRVLIAGSYTDANGSHTEGFARLESNGTLDVAFQEALVRSLESQPALTGAVQSDGRILVSTSFTTAGGTNGPGILRVNSDGSLDPAFRAEGLGGVVPLAVQSDGKVLITGEFAMLARLNPDGQLDPTFAPWPKPILDLSQPWNTPTLGGIALQPDDKVLLAGVNLWPFRLDTDGTMDTALGEGIPSGVPCGGSSPVYSVAVLEDGRILVGSRCGDCSSWPRPVWRFHPDGTLDDGFHAEVSGCGAGVPCIYPTSDGRVFIGGGFTTVNGIARSGIARLHADGTVDRTWMEGLAGIRGDVGSIVMQRDGKVVIAGNFGSVNGVPATGIVRLWGRAETPPKLKVFPRDDHRLVLSWEALPGRTYLVQYKEDLVSPNWISLRNDVTSSADGLASIVDTTTGDARQRFYRVVLLP